jgi:hypothetical protein
MARIGTLTARIGTLVSHLWHIRRVVIACMSIACIFRLRRYGTLGHENEEQKTKNPNPQTTWKSRCFIGIPQISQICLTVEGRFATSRSLSGQSNSLTAYFLFILHPLTLPDPDRDPIGTAFILCPLSIFHSPLSFPDPQKSSSPVLRSGAPKCSDLFRNAPKCSDLLRSALPLVLPDVKCILRKMPRSMLRLPKTYLTACHYTPYAHFPAPCSAHFRGGGGVKKDEG